MAHDYRYTLGEKRTTFFRWMGDDFSFLLFWADAQRESEAKRKPPRRYLYQPGKQKPLSRMA